MAGAKSWKFRCGKDGKFFKRTRKRKRRRMRTRRRRKGWRVNRVARLRRNGGHGVEGGSKNSMEERVKIKARSFVDSFYYHKFTLTPLLAGEVEWPTTCHSV